MPSSRMSLSLCIFFYVFFFTFVIIFFFVHCVFTLTTWLQHLVVTGRSRLRFICVVLLQFFVFCFSFLFWVVLFHPLFLRSLVFLITSRHQPTTMPSGFLSSSIYIHVFSSASLETRGPLPVTRCNLVNKCLSLFFSTLSFCQSFLPFFVLFSVWLGLGSRSLRSRGLINLIYATLAIRFSLALVCGLGTSRCETHLHFAGSGVDNC